MILDSEREYITKQSERYCLVLHTYYPNQCWDTLLQSAGHAWSVARKNVLKWLAKQSDFVPTEWDELLIKKLLDAYDSEF